MHPDSRERVQAKRTRRVWRFHQSSIQGSSSPPGRSAAAFARSSPSAIRRPTSSGPPPSVSAGTVRPHSPWASRRTSPGSEPGTRPRRRRRPSRSDYGAGARAGATGERGDGQRRGPRGGPDRARPARAARRAAATTVRPRPTASRAKLERLRVFEDAEGRMNLSVRDVGGELLCVSQFTLYGDARKGNRPSFVDAAPPEQARAALRARARRAGRPGRRLRRADGGGAGERRARDAAAGSVGSPQMDEKPASRC